MSDSKAPLRTVKRVQFGILSPDEIVSIKWNFTTLFMTKVKQNIVICINRFFYGLPNIKMVFHCLLF